MMVSRTVFWVVAVSSALFVGCGSEAGEGPPGPGGSGASAGGGAGGADDSGYSIVADPGTCQKLCCSAADCDAGQHCQAIDASLGTLGTCAPGEPPEPPTGQPGEFPASCWTKNEAECNPLTNEPCPAGEACDIGGLGDSTVAPVVACFGGDNTQEPGEACDNSEGPFCQPGYRCVSD